MSKYTLAALMVLLISGITFEQGTAANGISDNAGSWLDWNDSDTSTQQGATVLINEFRDTNSGCDDFDSYNAGEFLARQSPLWTTWDDKPAGPYDGYVVDDEFLSAPNSLGVDIAVLESDLIYNLSQTTSGAWSIALDIMVPTGNYGGYFNVMQDMELYGSSNEFGFHIFFGSDGTGYMWNADYNETPFTYTVGDWTHCELVVDLNNSWATFYLQDYMISQWQWDIAGTNMLSVIDIYADAPPGDDAKFYIDNVCFDEISIETDCSNLDTLIAGELLCPQSILWTTWDDNPGPPFDAYVVDGESLYGPNSIGVDIDVLESNLIYNLNQTADGAWSITLDIMIPEGTFGGYFSVMQDMTLYGAANEWGIQVYFRSDGTGYMYDADLNQTDFTYTVGVWTNCKLVVDLDNAWATFYVDGAIINNWRWDIAGTNMLGVLNIYAVAPAGDDPKFYIDNVCYTEEEPMIGCGGFDSELTGVLLAYQSPMWTTWDDHPGGPHDGYIVDNESLSGQNSLGIDIAVMESDLIYNLNNTTTGNWEITLDILVPIGDYGGYFSIMQNMELYGTANEWGFHCYFDSDGSGYFLDAVDNQTDFIYTVGDWTNCKLVVDLDNAWATFYVNGAILNDWQWDIAGPNMLGVIDVYAAAPPGDDPKFYIDNVCFTELDPVGIEPFERPVNSFQMFPNPVDDHVTITSTDKLLQIKIFNSFGQVVYRGNVDNNTIKINTQIFETGLYIVQIQTVQGYETRKLMKR